jgi:N-methylhydantoinase A
VFGNGHEVTGQEEAGVLGGRAAIVLTVGVDVGGTFTDVVGLVDGRLITAKLPTTPDQSEALARGVEMVAQLDDSVLLLHGTTIATNALLERKGARTVLITDAGFEDLIEIARQDRPSLYDPMADRPTPLVDRADRLGWGRGGELGELLDGHSPESVAIALLDSYRDGQMEELLAAQVKTIRPDVPISLSHLVSGEFREYERAATTVLSAYLQPPVARYLNALENRMRHRLAHILVMRSNGGLTPAAAAAQLAASIVLSGPAAGVVAAAACGSAHGWSQVISFDMGGTSTDVCRIEGGVPEVANERTIAGIACRMPSVAVNTIGAGGGSIGWVDPGGALRVGPHSAGARPGPASYGKGGIDATVTDAHLVIGRLGSERSLASEVPLEVNAARRAVAELAENVGYGLLEAAMGIVEVVDALMDRAIRRVSIEQGADPREAPLLAFGGAGGLHASSLARRLDMPAVIIPPHAGVFSALGLLLSPARHDVARTVIIEEGDSSLDDLVSDVAARADDAFKKATGAAPERIDLAGDFRYRGQSHETTVNLAASEPWSLLSRRFHEAHRRINGFSVPDVPVELVTLRATASTEPRLRWDSLPPPSPQGDARLADRRLPDGTVARRMWRPGLRPAEEIRGPAVIEEPEATTWLQSGDRALVLDDGTIEVTW